MPISYSQPLSHNRNRGFTLLEVMVALVIFSIGLLGLAGLQSQSLRYNHSAYLETQATYLAYDILDRMRANPNAAENGNYNATFSTAGTDHNCDSTTANCSSTDMAQFDIYEWKRLLGDTSVGLLPNGKGKVEQDGDFFVITLEWDDPGAANDTSGYTVRSEL